MTWQRIDENTYIDDTLVTCAEYQLFIDEMLNQLMFYQPDHWSTYQFPKGQALMPILGARHLDAEAFCKWLTKRETGKWRYRLPTQDEILDYPIKQLIQFSQLSNWVKEVDNRYQVAWIGSKPSNARRIEINKVIDVTRKISEHVNPGGNINETMNDVIEAFNQARNFPIARTRTLNFSLERERGINRAFSSNPTRHSEPFRDSQLNSALSNTFTNNHSFDEYVDIFTIMERIAGRSPAFEGIRLVKERIK